MNIQYISNIYSKIEFLGFTRYFAACMSKNYEVAGGEKPLDVFLCSNLMTICLIA